MTLLVADLACGRMGVWPHEMGGAYCSTVGETKFPLCPPTPIPGTCGAPLCPPSHISTDHVVPCMQLESACLNYQAQVDKLQREKLCFKEDLEARDEDILQLDMELSRAREELAKM